MAGEGRGGGWLDLLIAAADSGHSPLGLLWLAAALWPAVYIERHYRDWFRLPDYDRIAELERELGMQWMDRET